MDRKSVHPPAPFLGNTDVSELSGGYAAYYGGAGAVGAAADGGQGSGFELGRYHGKHGAGGGKGEGVEAGEGAHCGNVGRRSGGFRIYLHAPRRVGGHGVEFGLHSTLGIGNEP